MKHKNTGNRNIRQSGWRANGRNYVRRLLSRKAVNVGSPSKTADKTLPQNKPGGKTKAVAQTLLRLVRQPKPVDDKKNAPGETQPAADNLDGNRHSDGERWSSPRLSGLIAAVLLLAMLFTAALSSVGTARGVEEPTELAAQTGNLQLAKEYIYAGSRMLVIEDYGINSAATPTPTPTATPTVTPTPTPPTPTPTPVVASCPAGYSSLDGVITGNPTATVFNNTLFVFAKGTDNAIYYRNSADGSNFAAYVSLGGYLISDPATLVTYNALYVEASGGDNNRYYRATNDGVNFAEWVGGTVGTQTTASAYFNGNTYTFVKGSGTQPPLCVNVTAGGTPTPTPPTPTPTPEPPTPTPTPPDPTPTPCVQHSCYFKQHWNPETCQCEYNEEEEPTPQP